MQLGELQPLERRVTVPSSEIPAITINRQHPALQRILNDPRAQTALRDIQAVIATLAGQPGATPMGVAKTLYQTQPSSLGLGDGDDEMGWAFLIPMLAPIASKLLSGGKAPAPPNQSSADIGSVIAGLSQLLKGAPGVSPDGKAVVATISETMAARNQPGTVSVVPPPPPGATFTAADVQKIVHEEIAKQQGNRVSTGPGSSRRNPNAPGCNPGDVWGGRHQICYNPNYYRSEDEAYAYMTTGRMPTTAAPAAAPVPQVPVRAPAKTRVVKAKAVRTRKARPARRSPKKRGKTPTKLHGVMLNGVFVADSLDPYDINMNAPAAGGGSALRTGLLIGGALLAATGIGIAAMRARSRRALSDASYS